MQKIHWSEQYSVGVQSLDEQHKNFIDMVNGLMDDVQAEAELAVVADTLSRMKQHANEHFFMEERLMKLFQYPGIENHRIEHQLFIKKIVDSSIGETFYCGIEPRELMRYLHDWWHNHILYEDMKYKPYMAGKPVPHFVATVFREDGSPQND